MTGDMSKSIRTFVAVKLPETVLAAIGDVQAQLAVYGFNVRWVTTGNIHLTLKFIGGVHEDEVDGIAAVLTETVHGFAPLRLAAAGVGVFPSVKRARVIWVGLSGQLSEFAALQRSIEDRLATIGYPREKRPFSGHLTLGRVKGPIAASRLMTAMGAFATLHRKPLRSTGWFYSKATCDRPERCTPNSGKSLYPANRVPGEFIRIGRTCVAAIGGPQQNTDPNHQPHQWDRSMSLGTGFAIEEEKMSNVTDKARAVESAITQIERQFGKGSIMKLGDSPVIKVPVIPTGSLTLDLALGVGGLPRGRVVEIFGPESSGKTTLALHAVAEAQRQGGIAAFVDAEHALDTVYARKLGVNCDDLLVSQPDTGEQALEIADMLVRSGAIDVLVIDSVAALVPRAEIEGEMGDSHMGLQARLMSQALRKLTGTIGKTRTCVIFINQIRMKIGIVFGNPETTTGGNALKFYSSVRLDIRRVGAIKEGQEVTGNRTRVRVVKNKMAPPFKEAEFDITYGEGISKTGDLLDLGVQVNVIEKSGSWYSFEGERIGQGRENVKRFLTENPDIFAAALQKVREAVGLAEKAVEEKPKDGKSKTESDK